jgi:hypothetical protein
MGKQLIKKSSLVFCFSGPCESMEQSGSGNEKSLSRPVDNFQLK